MSLVISAEPVPLVVQPDGVIRVASTRVTLESVVGAFQEGLSAEEIAAQYPSLQLADVYAALGYYLNHQQEIDGYLRDRQDRAAEVRRENEQRWPPLDVRQRLLSRRK